MATGAPRGRRCPAAPGRPRHHGERYRLPPCPCPGGRLRPAPAVRASRPPCGLCAGDRRPTGDRWRGGGEPAGRSRPPLDRSPRTRPGLPAAIAAGDASRAVFAYGEATRQYELAIELWDLVDPARSTGGPGPGRTVRCRERGGDARRGRRGRRRSRPARTPARRCRVDDRPRSDADRERRARARERLGNAAWLAGDTATSINALDEAVALLDGTAASTIRARVLAGLAANLMLAARASESIGFAERIDGDGTGHRRSEHRIAGDEHPGRGSGDPWRHRRRHRAAARHCRPRRLRPTIRPSCRARTPTSARSSRWVDSSRKRSRCRWPAPTRAPGSAASSAS